MALPLTITVSGRRLEQCRHWLWFIAAACLTTALLLWLADFRDKPPPQPVQAARIKVKPAKLHYPEYESFSLGTDFAFRYHPLKEEAFSFAAPATGAPPPVPPDVAGLRLVATLPGTGRTYAIIERAGGGGQMLVPLGGMVGESFVSAIGPDFVELTRNGVSARVQIWVPWSSSSKSPNLPPSAHTHAPIRRTDKPLVTSHTVLAPSSSRDRRHLGITVRGLTDAERTAAGLPQGQGLLVTSVERSDIDLKENDVLLTIDGAPIFSIAMVVDALGASSRRALRFDRLRNGRHAEINIPLYE